MIHLSENHAKTADEKLLRLQNGGDKGEVFYLKKYLGNDGQLGGPSHYFHKESRFGEKVWKEWGQQGIKKRQNTPFNLPHLME